MGRTVVRRRFFDITAPSVPVIGTATALNESTIRVTWSAATDSGVGVASYAVYRSTTSNGTYSLVTFGLTSLQFDDTTLGASQQRFYKVTASDRAGNESAMSTAVSATTPDLTAPNVPTNLTASAISSSSANLTWTAPTDNVGVTGYRVYRNGLFAFGTVAPTGVDTGLSASTTYNYRVSAIDAAGNEGPQSTQASATTPSAGSIGTPYVLFHANTNGPRTGFENNNGTYVFLYVLNPPTFAQLMAGTASVTIGGKAVAGVCHVAPPNAPRLAAAGVMRIAIQVGALTGLVDGTAYPIVVTTPAGSSNANNAFNQPITFTPQPGQTVVVSEAGGVDGAAGTLAAPIKRLQDSSVTSGAPRRNGSGAGDTAGQLGTPPGTHIALRGGTYTLVGNSGRWANLYQITGRPATGAPQRGSICIFSFPGLVGSNAPEQAFWDAPAGQGGGFNGNDSTQANALVTAYGGTTRGWCQYMEITGIKIRSSSTSPSDAGPINTQCRAQFWRVIDNDLSWPLVNQGYSAGIEGSPQNGCFFGNHIHDIRSGNQTDADTNHAIYIDGYGSGTTTNGAVATGNIFAFNDCHDITAGNGVNMFDGVNGAGLTNNTIAFNWFKAFSKHGIYVSGTTKTALVYNNVVEDAGRVGINLNTSDVTAANGVIITNNTIYGWGRVAGHGAFGSESNVGSGSVRIENNIAMQKPGHVANGYSFTSFDAGQINLFANTFYDPDGRLNSSPGGTGTMIVNPLFTNAPAGDLTLQAGSPCVNTGNVPFGFTRQFGLELNPAPQGPSHDRGAYELAVAS